MGGSQSIVFRWKKKKIIRQHTNPVKPTLTKKKKKKNKKKHKNPKKPPLKKKKKKKDKLHMLSFALSMCHYDELHINLNHKITLFIQMKSISI